MRARLGWLAGGLVLVAACAGQPAMDHAMGEGDTAVSGDTVAVAAELARVRAATEAFHSLDAAVAAGYPREVASCIDNPPEGAMGYHHQNDALMDATIEIERPEILVYERMPDGEYRLNGVEYVVPFSAVPETAEPPIVMGQPLKKAMGLGIWYRHAWVWRESSSGMFGDWNSLVKCPGGG